MSSVTSTEFTEDEEEDDPCAMQFINDFEDTSMDTQSSKSSDGSSTGLRMPIPVLQPISLRPTDASGNALLQPGAPAQRPAPDVNNLPFKTVEDLHVFLEHSSDDALVNAPQLLKGAMEVLHHHFVAVPVEKLTFANILEKYYLHYQYSGGRLEIANNFGQRDLDAVDANLFCYGGHLLSSIEMLMIQSPHPEFRTMQSTLNFRDPQLNLWRCELYMRINVMNQITSNLCRAAIPNAATIHALEEQRSQYAQTLQLAQYMDPKTPPSTYLGFYTMHMVVKVGLRIFDDQLYEQIIQPKYTIRKTSTGDYICGHSSAQCPSCSLNLSGHRAEQKLQHVFTPAIEKVGSETVKTRSWRPFKSDGRKPVCGFRLRCKDASIKEFITAICSSTINPFAAKLIAESPRLVHQTEQYILMAKEPMLPTLQPHERAWSFYNGVLINTEFYSYQDIPSEYDSLSTIHLYKTWFLKEEIDRQLNGEPLEGDSAPFDIYDIPREPRFRFTGFCQNLYCRKCGHEQNTSDHSQCAEALMSTGVSSTSSGPKDMRERMWDLRCANSGCFKSYIDCECTNPTFYVRNPTQFLNIETEFFDRVLQPQLDAATMQGPTGLRKLAREEKMEVYNTITAMLGRPMFKVGAQAVLQNKTNVEEGKPATPTDDLNACFAVVGPGGTGKSTMAKILEQTLKSFGVLDGSASAEFWGEQLLDSDLEFKPIISTEIKSDFWPRERFCKATANEYLVVKRKNIGKDVVRIPEYQLTLIGNKWQLEEVEGSVARRVLMFLFTKRLSPEMIDPLMFRRIMMDIGAYLIKVQLSYAYFANRMTSNGLWSSYGVPQYFHYTKELVEVQNNLHLSFLRDGYGTLGEFIFHPNAYISEKSYLESFETYVKRKGMAFPEWTSEIYKTEFEDFKLHYVEKGKMVDQHGDRLTDGRYIRGIGFADEFSHLKADEADPETNQTGQSDVYIVRQFEDLLGQIEKDKIRITYGLVERLQQVWQLQSP